MSDDDKPAVISGSNPPWPEGERQKRIDEIRGVADDWSVEGDSLNASMLLNAQAQGSEVYRAPGMVDPHQFVETYSPEETEVYRKYRLVMNKIDGQIAKLRAVGCMPWKVFIKPGVYEPVREAMKYSARRHAEGETLHNVLTFYDATPITIMDTWIGRLSVEVTAKTPFNALVIVVGGPPNIELGEAQRLWTDRIEQQAQEEERCGIGEPNEVAFEGDMDQLFEGGIYGEPNAPADHRDDNPETPVSGDEGAN